MQCLHTESMYMADFSRFLCNGKKNIYVMVPCDIEETYENNNYSAHFVGAERQQQLATGEISSILISQSRANPRQIFVGVRREKIHIILNQN